MQPITSQKRLCSPVVYVQYFAPVLAQGRGMDRIAVVEAALKMSKFRRHLRGDGSVKGDIIPIADIWQVTHLIPSFEGIADHELTSENCLLKAKQWYLNSFSEDQVYQTVY